MLTLQEMTNRVCIRISKSVQPLTMVCSQLQDLSQLQLSVILSLVNVQVAGFRD